MLTLGAGVRVFVGVDPVDMRGSFDALAGKTRGLGLDPVDGHLYLFFSRNRRLCRIIWFDGSGWCVFSKRLSRGTFELPPLPGGVVDRIVVDVATLTSLLAGIDLHAARRPWYRRSVGA